MSDFWKNKTTIEKWIFMLLFILNALFLVYWIILAYNYCLHFDDAHFMWKLRDCSIFEYVKEMYMTRGGNFVSYGLNAIIFSISNMIGAYRFWAILFYFIGICMLYGIVKDIKVNIDKVDLFLIVVTFYNLYVLTSVDIAVFTWICAMEYYLYAPAICLIIKYVNAEKLTMLQLCLLILLSIFISGNSVSISIVLFIVLLVNGLYLWYSKSWKIDETWGFLQVRRLVYLTLLMFIIFLVVVIAPGNYCRMESEFDIELPKNIFDFFVSCGKCLSMFEYMMIFYLFYYVLIFVLGYMVGVNSMYRYTISCRKMILIVLVIYMIYVLISVLPLAFLSHGFQIQRNYTQISFFHILCIFLIGFILGNGKVLHALRIQITGLLFTIFMIVVVVLNIYKDLPVVCDYRKAHEERETYLVDLQKSGNKETIYVKPYPSVLVSDAKYNILTFLGQSANMQSIYYASDTGYELNEYESHIRHLLSLDFNFLLVQNENSPK